MRNTKLQPAFTRFLAVHELTVPTNMDRFYEWLQANGPRLLTLNTLLLADCLRRGVEMDPLWIKDLFEKEVGILTNWRMIPTVWPQ
jgi:hypothetical protein